MGISRGFLATAFCASVAGGAIAFLACSSDDGSAQAPSEDGGPSGADAADEASSPPTEKSSCEQYILAYCAKSNECEHTPAGRQDLCAQVAQLCPDYFFSPGSTRTIASMLECAQAWAKMSCDEFLSGAHPACQTGGTIEGGAPCIFSPQCESLVCVSDARGSCGRCATFYPPDAACSPVGNPVCPLGQTCNPDLSRCAPATTVHWGADGEPCQVDAGASRCQPGLSCVLASFGAASGKCQLLPGPGAPCAPTAETNTVLCDTTRAACSFTNAEMTAGTCRALGNLGDACDVQTPCGSNSYCKIPQTAAAGVCTALANSGEACGDLDGGYVFCGQVECAPPNGVDGGAPVCHAAPSGLGEPCTQPLASCRAPLACIGGSCGFTPYATCVKEAGTN